MTTKHSKQSDTPPVGLSDSALDTATGGAAHELAHVVQQGQTAQYNPKELSIDQSVPWQRQGG